MATTTITIAGATRTTLLRASLAMLGEEADRLAGALSAADRERHPEAARTAYESLRRVGELLETLGWQAGGAKESRVEVARQLPVALEALRRELECVQELVADARSQGDSQEVAFAVERERETHEALAQLEAGTPRAGSAEGG